MSATTLISITRATYADRRAIVVWYWPTEHTIEPSWCCRMFWEAPPPVIADHHQPETKL